MAVSLVVVGLAPVGVGCDLVTVNQEGQSVRVYTVEQVADALTDPVIGTVRMSKESVASQCFLEGGCPADHYSPDFELGRGASRSILVSVLAASARPVYRADLKKIREHSDELPLGSFAAWRANVEVTGPRRLRGRVLRLVRTMPPPTQTLGEVTPPARNTDVSGPVITHLDLDAPDAPRERIYLPEEVTRALRQVVPHAPAVTTQKAPCGREQPCTYVEYDDVGFTYGRRFSVSVSASSIGARQEYATFVQAGDDRLGDIALRVANVYLEGSPRLIRRVGAVLRGTPPSVPLNRVIAPRRDGGRLRLRAGPAPNDAR